MGSTTHLKKVGIREAKAHFSSLIARVKHGSVFAITERGREVAQLIPFPKAGLSVEERLKSLEERGLIIRAKKRMLRKITPVSIPGFDAQKILRDDRNRY